MAAKENALGEFLRARRDQVRPEDVGLVPGGPRRAPGLRREELAMLAGISAEHYLRLERGRATNPSPQVLEALAGVLQLDPKATRYLHELARPNVGRCDESELEAVAEKLDELIDQLPCPAIVANRYLDVLAANPVGRALSPGFTPGGKLPALAAAGPCRQRALRRLGSCDRLRGKRVTGIRRKRRRRSSLAIVGRRIIYCQCRPEVHCVRYGRGE